MNVRRITARAAAATWLLTLVLAATPLRADVKLSPLFGDHMVLQQGMTVPVWGMAAAGEQVTVSFGGQSVIATADDSGKWTAKLAALEASAKPAPLTVKGKNTITVNDVLVGEVWVCSGQSNMEWSVNASANPERERADAANYPLVRMFTVEKAVA